MAKVKETLELLESLMTGHEMTPEEIDDLVNNHVAEDLYLDYKHGKLLRDREEAARTLREYVAGFANSAGGVLIVGVHAPKDTSEPWTVTGCTAPGGGDLEEWASRSLTPIAPYLSPLYRSCVVPHTNGSVLVIATDRSLGFVPCVERDKKLTYHLRIHDQTLAAPDYLVSDLMLGKRQHAYLAIVEAVTWSGGSGRDGSGHYDWWFQLRFDVENQGLACAEDIRLGIVGLHGRLVSSMVPVSIHLLQHVTVRWPDNEKYKGKNTGPGQHVVSAARLEPFTLEHLSTSGNLSVPLAWGNDFYAPYEWKAAVYLLARNTPPTWYQLSITISSDLLQFFAERHPVSVSSEDRFMQIERLAVERPIVGWEGEKI